MRLAARLPLAVLLAASALLLGACNDGDNGTNAIARPYDVWQNPFLSPNPGNNIHGDSYLSDTYPYTGPMGGQAKVTQAGIVTFNDPQTGVARTLLLGECAAQTFDADGNVQSICAGVAAANATSVDRYVVTLDRHTLKVLACYTFQKLLSSTGQVDFGGAGYFYQDERYRIVAAMPNGHVLILRRTPSTVGGVDTYTADADYNLTGTGGSVPTPAGVASLDLYALVPDKVGNIWFTTAQGVVGTVDPSGKTRWLDLNDPNHTGRRQPQLDGGYETIANSHAVDEGDTEGGPSGVYILTTYHLYRLGTGDDGTPKIDWSAAYDRGTGMKSGQVSYGSGTSPTVFRMNSRRFVAIADNALYMNVNVYRAETTLSPSEHRLFAQAAPFGANVRVSDENSLIVAAGTDGNSADIYAENNYGNDTPASTLGGAVTDPGFARLHLQADGTLSVAGVNNTLAVPSVVSKLSTANNTVYTYNKTADGWYLTGLDATDLNEVRFTVLVGPGTLTHNNFYAALALDADRQTVWVGTLSGLTKVQIAP